MDSLFTGNDDTSEAGKRAAASALRLDLRGKSLGMSFSGSKTGRG